MESAQTLIKEIEIGKLGVDNKAEILELIETILVYKYPKISREEVKKMLGYNDISLKQTRFYQDVFAEGQHEGKLEGKLEGIQEGVQKGEANLILRILARRFGELNETTLKRIKLLTVNQLDELGEVLLDISTLTDLEKWLANCRFGE